jgi:hypothetical protein
MSADPLDDGARRVVPFAGAEVFARHSKYRLEDFDTLEPGSLTWRVKGLWPAVGLCFVGGPSMCGKSFWTLDAMARVCRGLPVLGRKSIKAGCVYIAAEGAHGVRNRIAGLRQNIGPLGSRFKFIGQQPNLTDPEDVADLRAVVGEAQAELGAAGNVLGMVVVDTLSAATPGADETTGRDMGPVLNALQTMATELQCLVLVVTHTGKDETRGLRGWSGQLGNADGVIMLTEPNGDLRNGTVLKVKDGPSGDAFGFALKVVELGHDDDGDAITTCTIEEREAPEAGAKPGRTPTKAAASAALIMTAYGRAFDERRLTINTIGAEGLKGVDLSRLRTMAYQIGVGPSEPEPSDDPTEAARLKRKWQDQRKADFDRGLDFLRTAKKLRTESGYAWEPASKRDAA